MFENGLPKNEESAIANKLEDELLAEIQKITTELKNYFRLGLTDFEMQYAIYPVGHFYKKHTDQKNNNNQRFFSFVIYLNDDWTPELEGNLCGYSKSDELLFNILPQINKMILFKSDILHEVLPCFKERYSVAGWMRSS